MLVSYKCFSVWAGKLWLGKLGPKKLEFIARRHVSNFFSFFLNPSGLVHPILVYHNFKIKSNLLAQRRSTCKIKSDPNYIPQTFHTGTNFSPVKIWQARLLWICLSVCLSVCLFKTGGSLVPNQSLLQTESQSKTCTPGLWAETARPKDNNSKKFDTSQNLTPLKFDSAAVSSLWYRAPPGFYRKFGKPAILSL